MEHHKLAQFAMIVSVILVSITLSPFLACISIYFYLIGWFTNKNEIAPLNESVNKYLRKINFEELKLTSKSVYKWGLVNICVQFFMAWVWISFLWSILIIVLFSGVFFLGIFSTKENIEELKNNQNWRFGRVW